MKQTEMPGLCLVATPIGNLKDISTRAVETLSQVDFIAAEDTRRTRQLLNHLDIKKPLVSYYEHNRRERGEVILNRILAGETCALVSDAGMPAISDPGEDLVKICLAAGVTVSVIPGPCAAVAALAVSGLATGRFCFEGFLSTATKSRREHLEKLKGEERTMIFYEAPHKMRAALRDMQKAFGDRKVTVVRELTKIHEEIFQGTFSTAIEKWEETPPKGELVLIIEGCRQSDKIPETVILPEADVLREEMARLREEGLPKANALKALSEKFNISRKQLYEIIK